jgi:hypothetical protein
MIRTLLLVLVFTGTALAQKVKVDVASGSARELETKKRLEEVLTSYDLSKYTFTDRVIIEEGATNHAFPVLTLHVSFPGPYQLLSSYIHEQIHWYQRAHQDRQQSAVQELKRMYPKVVVGLPESANTAESVYGHLVTCYLEIQADRRLMGPQRAAMVINSKRNYTWIYQTILRDEKQIAAVIARHQLEIR